MPKPQHVTYMGRRATVVASRPGTGRRTVTVTWIDEATKENGGHKAGTVVITDIKGDGRKPATFVLYSTTVVLPATV